MQREKRQVSLGFAFKIITRPACSLDFQFLPCIGSRNPREAAGRHVEIAGNSRSQSVENSNLRDLLLRPLKSRMDFLRIFHALSKASAGFREARLDFGLRIEHVAALAVQFSRTIIIAG